MRYTEEMRFNLFAHLRQYDAEDDYSPLIDILNTGFRSFGAGLLFFMEQKCGHRIDDPVSHLNKICLENGVPIEDIGSRNTLKDWFSCVNDDQQTPCSRPKKGDNSRKSMFAFAFAIKLTEKETQDLFHKVYLDRAFNFRDYRELIYYFCICNQLPYSSANSIISQISLSPETALDATIKTAHISIAADQLKTLDELVEYICQHAHSFSRDAKSAQATANRLKTQVEELVILEASPIHKSIEKEKADRKQLMAQGIITQEENAAPFDAEYSYDPTNVIATERFASKEHLYTAITGQSPDIDETGKKKSISFKYAALPTEIKNHFPNSTSLSCNSTSFEELRKLIILLFSYRFWKKIERTQRRFTGANYIAELNDCLSEVNLPPLYYGNPYDWLFLYCAKSQRPLDAFQGVLAHVLHPDTSYWEPEIQDEYWKTLIEKYKEGVFDE